MTALHYRRVYGLLGLLTLACAAPAADWPNWLGPNRNGSSPETGLLVDWPKAGPKVVWKVPGGEGYSSIAVAGGKAYTLVQRKEGELVLCLDTKTGKEIWQKRIAAAYDNKQGSGPRSTPTIEGKVVYIQSVSGPLVCMEADSGKINWEHDILKDQGAQNIEWGLSASPVIDGDLVLVIPGAPKAGVAAYNKTTGKLVWKAGSDRAGYSTPAPVTVDGKRQAIFFTASELMAVQSEDGKELWRIPWPCEYDCNICTPLVIGNQVFVSSGEKNGCAMFSLKGIDKPAVAWESKGMGSVMLNYWANAVVHDKHLYGLSGEFNSVNISLNCVELATGKLVWSKERFGKGAITLADGHLFITTKSGNLVLAPATPKGYQEKARIKLLGDNRTVPTIADKKLYLRDRKDIICLDIGGK